MHCCPQNNPLRKQHHHYIFEDKDYETRAGPELSPPASLLNAGITATCHHSQPGHHLNAGITGTCHHSQPGGITINPISQMLVGSMACLGSHISKGQSCLESRGPGGKSHIYYQLARGLYPKPLLGKGKRSGTAAPRKGH